MISDDDKIDATSVDGGSDNIDNESHISTESATLRGNGKRNSDDMLKNKDKSGKDIESESARTVDDNGPDEKKAKKGIELFIESQ